MRARKTYTFHAVSHAKATTSVHKLANLMILQSSYFKATKIAIIRENTAASVAELKCPGGGMSAKIRITFSALKNESTKIYEISG
jgi:hypothetical protein